MMKSQGIVLVSNQDMELEVTSKSSVQPASSIPTSGNSPKFFLLPSFEQEEDGEKETRRIEWRRSPKAKTKTAIPIRGETNTLIF